MYAISLNAGFCDFIFLLRKPRDRLAEVAGQLDTDASNKKKKKKTTRKRTFLQAGQCAALSSFRVKKWRFSGKRVGFLNSDK